MATTATIEKVVRRVIDEELSESREATLKAIQQMTRLLTEQVIPNLPDPGDAMDDEPEEQAPVRAKDSARAFGARAGRPGADLAHVPETPDDEDEPPAVDVPEAVTEALHAVYSNLSAEQAEALAALFTAIGQEPGMGDDSESEPGNAEEEAA
jgi:hypothetical protein